MIPNVRIENPKAAAMDGDLVPVLEAAVENWVNVIAAVLAQEQHKQLVGTGMIVICVDVCLRPCFVSAFYLLACSHHDSDESCIHFNF